RSVADVLAEDDVLGQRFRARGYHVDICFDPIDNRNVGASLTRSIERHTRWAKMRRAIAPVCFSLEPLLSPLVVASMLLGLAPSRSTAIAVAAACVLQVAGAAHVERALDARIRIRRLAVEPFRSYVTLLCWIQACVSRRVAWRGHAFELRAGSRLVP